MGRGRQLPPWDFGTLVMSSKSIRHLEQVERASALDDAGGRRQNLLRILFIHRFLADVERCLHELKRVRLAVSSYIVVTPEQFVDQLR